MDNQSGPETPLNQKRFEQLGYFELLVLAFAVGGCQGDEAVAEAQKAIAGMVRIAAKPKLSENGLRFRMGKPASDDSRKGSK